MTDQQQTLAECLRAVALAVDNHANAVTARAPKAAMVMVMQLYEDATTLDTLADEVEALEVDAAALREALEKIAHPIAWLQHQAAVQKAQLNGTAAVMLMRDPGWLRSVAADALSADAGKAMLERLRGAEAERDTVMAEVREWLCETCNTVYPGPPAAGVACVICPQCGGLTGPRASVELRRAKAERDELRRLLQQQYDRARTESPTNATCDNDGED